MDRIVTVSKALKRIFEFLVLLPIPISLILWIYAKFPERSLFGLPLIGGPIGFAGFSCNQFTIMGDVSPLMRLSGFIACLPLDVLKMYWVWQLRNLFQSYSHKKIFTIDSTDCIRRAALTLLAIPLVGVVVESILSVVLTANNPVGQRLLSVSFGTPQITDLLTGLVLVVIAWIMSEGQRLREEADLTV